MAFEAALALVDELASKARRIAKSFAAARDGLNFGHPRHAVQI